MIMDIFQISSIIWGPGDNTEFLTGIEKVKWVERYNAPGEFTIVGPPITLMEDLPLGSKISHTQTNEVMVVESHYIDESLGKDPRIVISGRSIAAYLMDNRVVSYNQALVDPPETDIWNQDSIPGLSIYPMHYKTTTGSTWNDVIELLNDHLVATTTGSSEDVSGLLIASYGIDGANDGGPSVRVTKKLSYLSDIVWDWLQAGDMGLKVWRPGPERFEIEQAIDPLEDFSETLMFILYDGYNLTDDYRPTFNFNDGDLHSVRYLWSIKDEKNSYYASNLTHTYKKHDPYTLGIATKVAAVNADDYVPESGDTDSDIKSVLESRGDDAINKSKMNGTIVDAIGSRKSSLKYNEDYTLGDVVNVFGNYGVNTAMRVCEVAFIQGKNGDECIPTLRPLYSSYYPQGAG